MSTANSFEYANWIALESVDLLVNKLSISAFFNKKYQKEFKKEFPVGDTIRVPYPDRAKIRTGLVYNPEAIDRRHTDITFQDVFGSDFEFDSVEEALKTPRGREQFSKDILSPRMAYIAQEVDSRCAKYAYQNAAGLVGILGTNPTTYDATSAAARQVMQELGCPPEGDRGMFVPPVVMRGVKTAAVNFMNPVRDISKQFRDGLVGYSDGFEWYESMSLYRHTAGTWAGAVTVTTTSVTGATTLSLTCTTGDTFKQGDKISIASVLPVNPMTRRTYGTAAKTFTITADATGASSAATISISPAIEGPTSKYQNVDALPQASAALTLWPGTASPNGKVGTVGLALHPNAFGLVSVDLKVPDGVKGSVKRDPDSGIAVAYIEDFDPVQRKKIHRFDAQIGFGVFFNDACSIAVACG